MFSDKPLTSVNIISSSTSHHPLNLFIFISPPSPRHLHYLPNYLSHSTHHLPLSRYHPNYLSPPLITFPYITNYVHFTPSFPSPPYFQTSLNSFSSRRSSQTTLNSFSSSLSVFIDDVRYCTMALGDQKVHAPQTQGHTAWSYTSSFLVYNLNEDKVYNYQELFY